MLPLQLLLQLSRTRTPHAIEDHDSSYGVIVWFGPVSPAHPCLQRNLFARNLHKRAERKEREREERKPIFQEDQTAGTGSAMDMDTFLDIGAEDDDDAAGRAPGRT
jgi:hypothetical protein